MAELKERNIPVSRPFGDNERYDILVEAPDGYLLRIQVKTGRYINGVINFRGVSRHTNCSGSVYETYDGDVDYFIVYNHRFDSLYLVSATEVNTSKDLRVGDSKIEHPAINWARDFEFDRCWPPKAHMGNEDGNSDQELTTNRRGDATEARVIAELLRIGVSFAVPPTDNERFDLILGSPAGNFYRVQVKTGWISKGCVTFRASSSHVNSNGIVHKPYDGDIDYFLAYEPSLEEMYFIAEDAFNSAIFLRIDESKRRDLTAHHAEDYLFEKNWPPEEGHRLVKIGNRPRYNDIWKEVFERLRELDAIVSEPVGDNAPYDLVAEYPDGLIERFALRVAQFKDGRLFFQPNTELDSGKVDYYILHCYHLDQLYLLNSSIVDSSITLRVEDPKQIRHTSLRAKDYELERQWPPCSGSRVPKTILMDMGIEACRDIGAEVAYPTSGDDPCDILLESADGRFLRTAIEPGWISNGRIRLKPDASQGIDYFLLVCRELETSYLIDANEFDVSISLRVEPPKRDDGTVNYADDYELESCWPISLTE